MSSNACEQVAAELRQILLVKLSDFRLPLAAFFVVSGLYVIAIAGHFNCVRIEQIKITVGGQPRAVAFVKFFTEPAIHVREVRRAVVQELRKSTNVRDLGNRVGVRRENERTRLRRVGMDVQK